MLGQKEDVLTIEMTSFQSGSLPLTGDLPGVFVPKLHSVDPRKLCGVHI